MKSGMMKQILAVTLAALTEVSGLTVMLPAAAVYAEEAMAEDSEEAAGEAADAEETETEQTLEIELVVYDSTVVLKNETGVDITVEFVEEDAEKETEDAEVVGVETEDAEAAAEDTGADAEDVEAAAEETEPVAEDAETEAGDAEAVAASGYLVLTDEDGEQHIFEDVDLLAAEDLVLTVENDVFYLNYLDENREACTIAGSLDEEEQETSDEDGQGSADEAGQETEDAEQSAEDAASAAAEAAVRAAAEAAASGGDGERTEVSRQKYDDCDGSGHGYYEITYSDGSTEIEEY